MDYNTFLLRFDAFARERGILWSIVGSWGMKAHGIARKPDDLDIVVQDLESHRGDIQAFAGDMRNVWGYHGSVLTDAKICLPRVVHLWVNERPRCVQKNVLGGTYPVDRLEETYYAKCGMLMHEEGDKHDLDMRLIEIHLGRSALTLL